MSLQKPEKDGNMYPDYHRWNPIAGCKHNCAYCYVKPLERRFKKDMTTPAFRETYLKDSLGHGKKIFVGSSSDSWGQWVQPFWIIYMLERCSQYPNNQYLFLTKNPHRYKSFVDILPPHTTLGTTIETNSMSNMPPGITLAPPPLNRVIAMQTLRSMAPKARRMVSIEPIMDFQLKEFLKMMKNIHPHEIYVGADSGNNGLPEPEPGKLKDFIKALKDRTGAIVTQKKNLKRLLEG